MQLRFFWTCFLTLKVFFVGAAHHEHLGLPQNHSETPEGNQFLAHKGDRGDRNQKGNRTDSKGVKDGSKSPDDEGYPDDGPAPGQRDWDHYRGPDMRAWKEKQAKKKKEKAEKALAEKKNKLEKAYKRERKEKSHVDP